MLRNGIILKKRYKEYRRETHLKISFCKFLKELQYSNKDIINILVSSADIHYFYKTVWRFMQKILSYILLILVALSFILMCAENPDGSINLLWTLGWLGVMVLSALLWHKLNPEKYK